VGAERDEERPSGAVPSGTGEAAKQWFHLESVALPLEGGTVRNCIRIRRADGMWVPVHAAVEAFLSSKSWVKESVLRGCMRYGGGGADTCRLLAPEEADAVRGSGASVPEEVGLLARAEALAHVLGGKDVPRDLLDVLSGPGSLLVVCS
jgi:hypothetical protein